MFDNTFDKLIFEKNFDNFVKNFNENFDQFTIGKLITNVPSDVNHIRIFKLSILYQILCNVCLIYMKSCFLKINTLYTFYLVNIYLKLILTIYILRQSILYHILCICKFFYQNFNTRTLQFLYHNIYVANKLVNNPRYKMNMTISIFDTKKYQNSYYFCNKITCINSVFLNEMLRIMTIVIIVCYVSRYALVSKAKLYDLQFIEYSTINFFTVLNVKIICAKPT